MSITALKFNISANRTYRVELDGAIQASAATTGFSLVLKTPGATDRVIGGLWTFTAANTVTGLYSTSSMSGSGATTGLTTANANVAFRSWFNVKSVTTGQLTPMLRSEVAGSRVMLVSGLTVVRYRRVL